MLPITLKFFLSKTKQYNGYFAIFFVLSLFVILFNATSYANNQNMERHKLTQEIQALEDEYRLLNTQTTQLQTTQRIEEESKRLNLVKVQTGDIRYLDDTEKTVALRY